MTAQPIATTAPINRAGLIPATFSHGKRAGSKTDKVLVNPVTGTHFCADCDYTGERFSQVFAHRRAHGKPQQKKVGALDERVTEAVVLLMSVRDEIAGGDGEKRVSAEWKARALSAEKQLKSLRRILGNTADAS